MNCIAPRYFSNDDLRSCGLLDYADAVRDTQLSLLAHREGSTLSDRVAIDLDYGHKLVSSVLITDALCCCKWTAASITNPSQGLPRSHSMLALHDTHTGIPIALMDGTTISALRTGCYVALAIEHLARPNSTLLFVGTGVVAKAAAAVVFSYAPASVRIRAFTFHSPNAANMARFHDDITRHLDITCVARPATTLASAIADADVTVSLNTASDVLFCLDNVKAGSTHIHIGGRDDDLSYIAHCANEGKLVCDDWEQTKKRKTQDVAFAYYEQMFSDSSVYAHLSDIIAGHKRGREADELIYFNAVGMPDADFYIARRLLRTATDRGIPGLLLPLSTSDNWIVAAPASLPSRTATLDL